MSLRYAPLLVLATGCEPSNTLANANQNGIITKAQADGVQKEADAFIKGCRSLSTRNLDLDINRRAFDIEIRKIKDDVALVNGELDLAYETDKPALHPEICGGNKDSVGYVSCLASEESSLKERLVEIEAIDSACFQNPYNYPVPYNYDSNRGVVNCPIPTIEDIWAARKERDNTKIELGKHFDSANKILGGKCIIQTPWKCKENREEDRVPVLAGEDFEHTDHARTVLISCD